MDKVKVESVITSMGGEEVDIGDASIRYTLKGSDPRGDARRIGRKLGKVLAPKHEVLRTELHEVLDGEGTEVVVEFGPVK